MPPTDTPPPPGAPQKGDSKTTTTGNSFADELTQTFPAPKSTDTTPKTPDPKTSTSILPGALKDNKSGFIVVPKLGSDIVIPKLGGSGILKDKPDPLRPAPSTSSRDVSPAMLGGTKLTQPRKPDATVAPLDRTPAPSTVVLPNPFKPLPKVDYDRQQAGGMDVANPRPGAEPPKYPGPPHDQDKEVLEKLLKPSRAASLLYQLYLETYTDRSPENRVPDKVRIAELHPGIKEKIGSIELLGDSEMFQKDMHGLVLHPTGQKHPGHFFAVVRDNKNIPINVIEYTTAGGKPKYLQQWIFDRDTDKTTGERKTTISYFRETSSTAMGRPGGENGTMADVYMGRTEYVAASDGGIVRAMQYNNLNKPTVQVDYGYAQPKMQLRDPNSGELGPSPFSRAFMMRMAFSGVYLK